MTAKFRMRYRGEERDHEGRFRSPFSISTGSAFGFDAEEKTIRGQHSAAELQAKRASIGRPAKVCRGRRNGTEDRKISRKAAKIAKKRQRAGTYPQFYGYGRRRS